jgi:ABC-2 type transport system permease protein
MTTATLEPVERTQDVTAPRVIPRPSVLPVELRKMFDTRSGFWLLASILIASVLTTASVIAFAPDEAITFGNFGAAVGIPMSVLLPIIAILSVTSEWSQRSGLTTFTLVPHRGRVVAAKLVCAVAVGVVAILVAFGAGAIGNIVGAAIAGIDPVWDIAWDQLPLLVLANVVGLLVGFMLGVLIRNSAGAIVAYFVYAFVLPTLSMTLAALQDWYRDLQPWVDFNYNSTALYEGGLTGEQWAQLGVTSIFWLVIPLAVGVSLVLRSEVK